MVHSLASSDPILGMVSSSSLVDLPGFNFFGGSYYFGGGCSGLSAPADGAE